jgi:hypothetical protein
VRTLDPGAYTAILRGFNGSTGVALVEIYDLDPGATSKLANISTRGFVQTGDSVMIGGLIVQGSNPIDIIVRATGPALVQLGVPNVLNDPMLEVFDAQGSVVGSNDDWKQTQQAQIQASGFAPAFDAESAVMQTLPPGSYTAIIRGKGGSLGNALVEIYSLN